VTLQATHRQRVLAAMERRRLTPAEVARMARLHPRTVQRFLDGTTFSLKTLADIEAALCIGGSGKPVEDSESAKFSNVQQVTRRRPVIGWFRAAAALGVSWDTLRRRRKRAGEEGRKPWWKDVEALKRWYEAMLNGEVR
jgi:hypothetical protein